MVIRLEIIKKCKQDFNNLLISGKTIPNIADYQDEFFKYLEQREFSKILTLIKKLSSEYDLKGKERIISFYDLIATPSLSYVENSTEFIDQEQIPALVLRFEDSMVTKQTIQVQDNISYSELKRVSQLMIGNILKRQERKIFPFLVSNNIKLVGRITHQLSARSPYSLIAIKESKSGFKANYIGDQKKGIYGSEDYIEDLYTYYFIDSKDQKEYTLLSKKPLPLAELIIEGMNIPIYDALKIGSEAKLSKGAEIIYVINNKPLVDKINDESFAKYITKYKDNYELLYKDYFGKFRHPKIFEFFLLAWLFSSECSYGPIASYKPNLGIIGPTRGGKSTILDSISRVFKEHKYGENTTIKGFVPSFGGKTRPQAGAFIKSRRFCLAEEFINTASKNKDLTSLDVLKSLLVHDDTTSSSGKFDGATIRGAPTATFVFASNFLTYKITNFVELSEHISPAVLARFILYIQTPEHFAFIKDQQRHIGKNKSETIDDFLPTFAHKKIEVYDYLLHKKVKYGDFNEFDIINPIKSIIPAQGAIHEIYNSANEHLTRLIDGVVKVNYIVEGRNGELKVTKKDFEDARKIWYFIISSWTGDISKLPRDQKMQHLTQLQSAVYAVIKDNQGITREAISKIIKNNGLALNKLFVLQLIASTKIGDTVTYYTTDKSRMDVDVDDN